MINSCHLLLVTKYSLPRVVLLSSLIQRYHCFLSKQHCFLLLLAPLHTGGVKLNLAQAAAATAVSASEWMAFDLCIDPSDLASSTASSAPAGPAPTGRRLLADSANVSLLLRLGDTGDYADKSDGSFGWDGGAVAVMVRPPSHEIRVR